MRKTTRRSPAAVEQPLPWRRPVAVAAVVVAVLSVSLLWVYRDGALSGSSVERLLSAGDLNGAIEAARAAVADDQASFAAKEQLATLLERRALGGKGANVAADAEEALKVSLAMAEADPKSARAQHLLGVAYAIQGTDLGKARERLRTAIRYAPEEPSTYVDYGLVLERLGMVRQAPTIYASALKVQPTYGPAAVALARLDLDAGKLDDVAKLADVAAQDADPQIVAEARRLRVLRFVALGQVDEASKELAVVASLAPTSASLTLAGGEISYLKAKKAKRAKQPTFVAAANQALATAGQVLRTNPLSVDGNALAYRAAQLLGDDAKAAQYKASLEAAIKAAGPAAWYQRERVEGRVAAAGGAKAATSTSAAKI